ncbi:MAG: hypothetical protein QM533_07645 [Cytophagales bacterium]|nr:hypothetical protein [Cytophagales bacterium]
MPLHPNAILASSLGEQGDYEGSQQLGNQALLEQDALMRAHAAIHGRVVAYSLYGSEPLYGEGAVLNAQAIRELLPSWEMRVYHDDSVSPHLLGRLREAGAQTFAVTDLGIAHWPGTFWRFYVLNDPHIERVLFRDADSLISLREVSLIDEWLQSPYPFHVMRDWYTHVELILAGLWGAYAPFLAHMPTWIEHYLAHEMEHDSHDDQIFLAKYIWPRICQHTLLHDSVHPVLGAQPIRMERESFDVSVALGGYAAVSYPVTLTPPLPKVRYRITITDSQSDELICAYEREAMDGVDKFRIPGYHSDMIKAGRWTIAVAWIAS